MEMSSFWAGWPLSNWLFFSQNVILFSKIIPYNCNISVWKWSNIWIFSTIDADGQVLYQNFHSNLPGVNESMLPQLFHECNPNIMPKATYTFFYCFPGKYLHVRSHICTQQTIHALHSWLNSLWLCDAIWWDRSRSSLVQIMACCTFNTKPLSDPMLTYCQLPWRTDFNEVLIKPQWCSFMQFTLIWLGLFFFKTWFNFLILFTLCVIVLYETGPIQWMFSQHCGYWWPGA